MTGVLQACYTNTNDVVTLCARPMGSQNSKMVGGPVCD